MGQKNTKLEYARIVLNSHPDGKVHEGDVIHGSLEYRFKVPMNLRGIRIELIGLTHTHWTRTYATAVFCTGGVTAMITTVNYGYKQYHVKTLNILWGSPSSASRKCVQPVPMEDISLPFTIQVPTDIPQSIFCGRYGFTKYYIRAVFDRPWKKDYAIEQDFDLVCDVSLNHLLRMGADVASLTKEVHFENSIRMVCCCFPCLCAGKFHYQLTMGKLGYVPGEFIVIYGRVVNNTGRILEKLRFQLIQKTKYYGRFGEPTYRVGRTVSPFFSSTVEEYATVQEFFVPTGESIEDGDEVILGTCAMDSCVRIPVPEVHPTRKNDGTPVKIQYHLVICADHHLCLNVSKNLGEIFIGNVPMIDLQVDTAGSTTTMSTTLLNNETPPPSYPE